MKTLLLLFMFCVSLPTFAQQGKGAQAYKTQEAAFHDGLSCLSAAEYAGFKTFVISAFNKDPAFKSPRDFGVLDMNCLSDAAGKLIGFTYGFGPGGTISQHFILLGAGTLQDLKLTNSGPLPQGISRMANPHAIAFSGKLVTLEFEAFTDSDPDCCPGFRVKNQYEISRSRLVFVKQLAMAQPQVEK